MHEKIIKWIILLLTNSQINRKKKVGKKIPEPSTMVGEGPLSKWFDGTL